MMQICCVCIVVVEERIKKGFMISTKLGKI